MKTHKGKEFINPQQHNHNDLINNSIYRPLKIQKIDIPFMSTDQFQDPDASTSGGQPYNHEFHTPPAGVHSRTHQENTNQESSGSSMNSEGPFFVYEDKVVGEGIKQCTNNILGKLLTTKQIPKKLYTVLSWASGAALQASRSQNWKTTYTNSLLKKRKTSTEF